MYLFWISDAEEYESTLDFQVHARYNLQLCAFVTIAYDITNTEATIRSSD